MPIPDYGSHTIKVIGKLFGGDTIESNTVPFYILNKKIAAMFWSADAGYASGNPTYDWVTQNTVNYFRDALIDEGYQIFIWKNTYSKSDFDARFQQVKYQVEPGDVVFFYFCAHGGYENSDSYLSLGTSAPWQLSSSYFRGKMNELGDAVWKGFLVDGCRAGDFVTECQTQGYLAMTATNYYTDIVRFYGEVYFTRYFADYIHSNHDAIEAFNHANSICAVHGMIYDGTSHYDFFNDFFND